LYQKKKIIDLRDEEKKKTEICFDGFVLILKIDDYQKESRLTYVEYDIVLSVDLKFLYSSSISNLDTF
jgi:hypothetical protein